MAISTILVAAVSFTSPSCSRPQLATPQQRAVAPKSALTPFDTNLASMATLIAEDGGFNPVFLLLGALPLIAGGAFVFVSAEEKKVAARRADPANADRLGFTEEEVAGFDGMKKVRWEADVKQYMADKAKAAELGMPVEQVIGERVGTKKPGSYFNNDDTEVAGSTRF